MGRQGSANDIVEPDRASGRGHGEWLREVGNNLKGQGHLRICTAERGLGSMGITVGENLANIRTYAFSNCVTRS